MKVRYEPMDHCLVTDDIEMRIVAVFSDSITQGEAQEIADGTQEVERLARAMVELEDIISYLETELEDECV